MHFSPDDRGQSTDFQTVAPVKPSAPQMVDWYKSYSNEFYSNTPGRAGSAFFAPAHPSSIVVNVSATRPGETMLSREFNPQKGPIPAGHEVSASSEPAIEIEYSRNLSASPADSLW